MLIKTDGILSHRNRKMGTNMRILLTHLQHIRHPDIEHYRLEPFMDLNVNRIIGYEVLSQLRDGLDAEQWFTTMSGRQQIDILLEQIHCVSAKIKEPCFYNLSVDGFLSLNHCDISRISGYDGICLEVSDASTLKYLDGKEKYLLLKRISRLRYSGVKIWLDDFAINDLITLPTYRNNIDGIKIDKSEVNSVNLRNIISLVKLCMGCLPIVVEGIETERVRYETFESGADIGQGYLWGQYCLAVA